MIRKATLSDTDAIESLYNEIHTLEEAGVTHTGWIRGIYPTRATATNSITKGEMYVFELENEIVATAKINQEQEESYKSAKWNYDAPDNEVMVIHTIVVSPRHKGKGIGASFVKFYEQYALQCGCKYLRMDTNETNTAARGLYKKLGYAEVGIVPTLFNGISGVNLVCLEKTLNAE